MKRSLAAISGAALIAASSAWAAAPGTGNLSRQDRQFVEKAGAGNLAEARLGKLALRTATTPALREFGRWMMTDHGLANRRLKAVAEPLHAWQKPHLTARQRSLARRLEAARGAQFDREYTAAIVSTHEQAVPLFEKEATKGQDKAIKAYAQNWAPVIRRHLAEAKRLADLERRIAAGTRAGAPGTAGSGSSIAPARGARH